MTTATSNSLTVDLKVTYDKIQRRISLSTAVPDWNVLAADIKERFSLPVDFKLALSYQDEDGDTVVISSSKELAEIWPVITEEDERDLDALPPLRFTVSQLSESTRARDSSTPTIIENDIDNNDRMATEAGKEPYKPTLREDVKAFIEAVKSSVQDNEKVKQAFDKLVKHGRKSGDSGGDDLASAISIADEEIGKLDALTAGIVSALLTPALMGPPHGGHRGGPRHDGPPPPHYIPQHCPGSPMPPHHGDDKHGRHGHRRPPPHHAPPHDPYFPHHPPPPPPPPHHFMHHLHSHMPPHPPPPPPSGHPHFRHQRPHHGPGMHRGPFGHGHRHHGPPPYFGHGRHSDDQRAWRPIFEVENSDSDSSDTSSDSSSDEDDHGRGGPGHKYAKQPMSDQGRYPHHGPHPYGPGPGHDHRHGPGHPGKHDRPGPGYLGGFPHAGRHGQHDDGPGRPHRPHHGPGRDGQRRHKRG